jgi:hypothetical protein
LGKEVKRCVWDMLLQSTGIEKGGSFLYSKFERIWLKKVEGQRLFHVDSQEEPVSHVPHVPPVLVPVPSHSYYRTSKANKYKHSKKEYLKQISELAEIIQQQHLENKKLEKFFSHAKRKSLQLSLALSQKQEIPPSDPWNTFVTSEVTGSYYVVARGKWLSSFGIYADVNEFLLEVNGVVGYLFKVCESY